MKCAKTHCKYSQYAQLLFDAILDTSSHDLMRRSILKILILIRQQFLRIADPLVRYNLNGIELLLPLSHELPLYRINYPYYSLNVGRIAHHVAKKYNQLRFLDIGANVGDTVAILRSFSKFPILCIEGDKEFFTILESNLASFNGDVDCENSFVGSTTGTFKGVVQSEGGTAFLVSNFNSGAPINVKRLTDILKDHPLFKESKMIKIDTDGYDSRILISEKDFLAKTKPVIFIEYDPYASERYGDDCFSVFDMLKSIGYEKIMIYDNYGDYILTATIDNKDLLEDIHQYYSGRASKRYADICAFHEEDSDLVKTIKSSEVNFFHCARKSS